MILLYRKGKGAQDNFASSNGFVVFLQIGTENDIMETLVQLILSIPSLCRCML